MKTLTIAFLLAIVFPVQAQRLDMPKTIKLHNNATGEPIGTATISGNRVFIRDKNGEFVATIEQNPDGTKTTYDPHGNVIEAIQLPK